MELVEWLTGVLDEDERVARAAIPGPWVLNAERDRVIVEPDEDDPDEPEEYREVCSAFALTNRQQRANAKHIALHDPATVLADIAAKRRTLTIHRQIVDPGRDSAWPPPGHCLSCWNTGAADYMSFPCVTVRALASAYAHRDGFDPSWT